jgi:hypothetical protein
MRIYVPCFLGLTLILTVCGHHDSPPSAQLPYAPEKGELGAFPVRGTAHFGRPPNNVVPRFALGCLPAAPSAQPQDAPLVQAFYDGFRDNQLGFDGTSLWNAAAEAYARGTLQLTAPRADQPLVLAITTPYVDSVMAWEFNSLRREDHSLVVVLDAAGIDATNFNGSHRFAQDELFVRIPPLQAGTYDLQIRMRERSRQSVGVWRTGTSFTLLPPNSSNAGGPILIPDFDRSLPAAPATGDEYEPDWYYTARRFNLETLPPGGHFGLTVGKSGTRDGTQDPFAFLTGLPGLVQEPSAMPELLKPTSDDITYALVFLPEVDSHVITQLRSQRWQGNHVIIDVDQWTDVTIPRSEPLANANSQSETKSYPMILVHLSPPTYVPASVNITPPGHYVVDLRVHNMVAKSPDGWYSEQPPTLKNLITRVEFDVKK